MDQELKTHRIITLMAPSELEAIDDWSFKNRIRSRGDAIRRLCHIGTTIDASSGPLLDQKKALDQAMVDLDKIRSELVSDDRNNDAFRSLDVVIARWAEMRETLKAYEKVLAALKASKTFDGALIMLNHGFRPAGDAK